MSKAKDDFPEPDTPAMTTNLLRGIYKLTFLRLFTLAPFISIYSSMTFVFKEEKACPINEDIYRTRLFDVYKFLLLFLLAVHRQQKLVVVACVYHTVVYEIHRLYRVHV